MQMMLTTEQQRQIDSNSGQPVEVIDPRQQKKYLLVPADEYEALRDDAEQVALRQASLSNLAQRLHEDEK